MTRRAVWTTACTTLAMIGAAIGWGGMITRTNAAATLSGDPLDLADHAPEDRLEKAGRRIFRHDTFGDEQLWTGVLRMHEVIATIPPTTALAVGLKVDAEALPAKLVAALRAGRVDLTDPAVTVDLLRRNAVVGVRGEVRGTGRLTRVGITCALCHSTVDNALAPGIGKRLDGWANTDLDVGRSWPSRRRWMRRPRPSSTPGVPASTIPATTRSTARASCR